MIEPLTDEVIKILKEELASEKGLHNGNVIAGLIATVESLKEIKDASMRLLAVREEENAKLKADKAELETLCKFLEKENGLLRIEVDLK